MPVVSVFPLWHIALTAAIAFGASLIVLLNKNKRAKIFAAREVLLIALVVGVSVLVWLLAANVPALNDDPIPLFSPNDLVCPIVTYVSLGLYGAFRRENSPEWESMRARLTIVSFVVNVIII